MQRIRQSIVSAAVLVAGLGALAACGGDDDDDKTNIDGGGPDATVPTNDGGGDGGVPAPKEYSIGSIIYGMNSEGDQGYVTFAPSVELGGARVELGSSASFGGQSDHWVLGSSVYIADGDRPRITRHVRDAMGKLVLAPEPNTVDFGMYTSDKTQFWKNIFVSPTKAYLANGPDELIVWNPTTMTITPTTIKIPNIAAKPSGNLPNASFADRSNIVRDGKLYRVIYWAKDFATFEAQSQVVIIDTNTDMVQDQIDIACGGLDYGTLGGDGKLYFSNWTFSVGAALVLPGQPPTCFAQLDPATKAVTVTNFSTVTRGYEAAALRYIGGTKFAFSVIDVQKGDPSISPTASGSEVIGGSRFQLWSYDVVTHAAAPIEGIAKNSGAVYEGQVKGQYWALVPGAGYASTAAYKLVDGKAIKGFEMNGWVLRLFPYPN